MVSSGIHISGYFMASSQLAPGITLALTYICNCSVAVLSLAFV